ncbi:Amino acid permease [Melia azedarach]|uniref:Amino acid permease n=1 Tax=Melia azedarach TaxID=155640 RepID=A0ACC1WS04_MELAZ|nr:Amino acid permease [Melia azedarach]
MKLQRMLVPSQKHNASSILFVYPWKIGLLEKLKFPTCPRHLICQVEITSGGLHSTSNSNLPERIKIASTSVLLQAFATTFTFSSTQLVKIASTSLFVQASATPYAFSSTEQIKIASTSLFAQASATTYAFSSTKLVKIASTSLFVQASANTFAFSSTQLVKIACTSLFVQAASTTYAFSSTERIKIASTSLFVQASSTTYAFSSTERIKIASTSVLLQASVTTYAFSSTERIKIASNSVLLQAFITTFAFSSTQLVKIASTSVFAQASATTYAISSTERFKIATTIAFSSTQLVKISSTSLFVQASAITYVFSSTERIKIASTSVLLQAFATTFTFSSTQLVKIASTSLFVQASATTFAFSSTQLVKIASTSLFVQASAPPTHFPPQNRLKLPSPPYYYKSAPPPAHFPPLNWLKSPPPLCLYKPPSPTSHFPPHNWLKSPPPLCLYKPPPPPTHFPPQNRLKLPPLPYYYKPPPPPKHSPPRKPTSEFLQACTTPTHSPPRKPLKSPPLNLLVHHLLIATPAHHIIPMSVSHFGGQAGRLRSEVSAFTCKVAMSSGSNGGGVEVCKQRTGTVSTASFHMLTTVIGYGILSLPRATAQLGLITGPAVILLFAFVTYYTSTLLSACYRSGNEYTGQRNSTYMDVVRSNLGKFIFSQIPDSGQLFILTIITVITTFTYSAIGVGLSIATVAETGKFRGSLTGFGTGKVTAIEKIWRSFQALGDIAFAYGFSVVLIEIMDTLKSPPSEAKTMKKACLIGLGVTTLLYMLCACFGYAAFGDLAAENFLDGFVKPHWLLEIANAAVVLHLICSYQVYCQPLFALVEKTAAQKYPDNQFITRNFEVPIPESGTYKFNLFRLIWRTMFVIITTVVAMKLTFFKEAISFLGAWGFWPLTVYFPVEIYIAQKQIPTWSSEWIWLQMLSFVCLIVTIAAVVGSIAGIVLDFQIASEFLVPHDLQIVLPLLLQQQDQLALAAASTFSADIGAASAHFHPKRNWTIYLTERI